jgi:hypothetical protein
VHARIVDEDPPHQPCRQSKKVGTVFPARRVLTAESKIHFVNKRRALQRVSIPFALQMIVRELPELFVNDGRKLVESFLVSAAPSLQQLRDFTLNLSHVFWRPILPASKKNLVIRYQFLSPAPLFGPRVRRTSSITK